MLRASLAAIVATLLALGSLSCSKSVIVPSAPLGLQGWITYVMPDSSAPPGGALEQQGTIWVARLDGTRARSLGVTGMCPSWNPAGTAVAYRYYRSLGDPVPFVDAGVINPSTGQRASWHVSWPMYGTRPAEWRFDGRQIAAGGSVLTPPAWAWSGASSGRELFGPAGASTLLHPVLLQWAGDSLHFLARAPNAPTLPLTYDYYIVECDFAGCHVVTRLTSEQYADTQDPLFVLSPDGSKLLGADGSVFAFDLKAHTVPLTRINITSGPMDLLPRWGSDSRTIVFLRREGTQYFLYRTSLDSLGITRKILNQPASWGGVDIHLD